MICIFCLLLSLILLLVQTNTYMFMIKIYCKRKSAQLTVVFQESKSCYSPMVELVVSLSAHKLEYIIITHRHSLEWFVQASLKYMQLYLNWRQHNLHITESNRIPIDWRMLIRYQVISYPSELFSCCHHFVMPAQVVHSINGSSLFIIISYDPVTCQSLL